MPIIFVAITGAIRKSDLYTYIMTHSQLEDVVSAPFISALRHSCWKTRRKVYVQVMLMWLYLIVSV